MQQSQKGTGDAAVSRPGIGVADMDGKEFEEAPGGLLPCPRDERGKFRSDTMRNDI